MAGEPLTGRKITLILYPVAQMELQELYSPFQMRERSDEFLTYGSCPEVVVEGDIKEVKTAKGSFLKNFI